MRAEISYDLVMDDDMSFVEGTYRLPGGEWQILIVPAFHRGGPVPQVIAERWESGATGVTVRIPLGERINADSVERLLSVAFGVTDWVRVRGPDSMGLR